MENEKLKPCPGCGKEDIYITAGAWMKYIVICRDCGFRSGLRDTPEEATEAWNTRHYPLPSEEEMHEAVKRMAKESTAPDKETPDWLESDIRRGVRWLIEFIKTNSK
jgi:Lar family restriction alleviation protein